jgi:hypothetical protein
MDTVTSVQNDEGAVMVTDTTATPDEMLDTETLNISAEFPLIVNVSM